MKGNDTANIGDVVRELRISNRLRILALVRDGIQQKDLAAALEIDPSQMSRMFPKGVLARVAQAEKPSDSKE